MPGITGANAGADAGLKINFIVAITKKIKIKIMPRKAAVMLIFSRNFNVPGNFFAILSINFKPILVL